MKSVVLAVPFICASLQFICYAEKEPPVIPEPLPLPPLNVTNGLCECGAFEMATPGPKDCPIIQQDFLNVTCNEEGANTCNKLCKAVSEAAKESAPTFLCGQLHHYINLTATLHSRICETEPWQTTGLTSEEICCHSYKPIDCEELLNEEKKKE